MISKSRLLTAICIFLTACSSEPTTAQTRQDLPTSIPNLRRFDAEAVVDRAQSVGVQHGNLVYRNASGATELLTETGADGSPVISPDGSMVAFLRLRSGENVYPNDPSSGALSDVYVIRISDHALTKIVTAAHSATGERTVWHQLT